MVPGIVGRGKVNMTEHPNDAAGEPERPRGSTEQQSSGKPPAWEPEEPSDEKSGGEKQESEMEIAAGTEQGVAEIPRRDFPARRLRDFIQRRFPGGLPESSMPWAIEPDELKADGDKGEDAENATTEAKDGQKGASPDASGRAPGDAGSSDENQDKAPE